jgi:malate dehydrogenase (quinone)
MEGVAGMAMGSYEVLIIGGGVSGAALFYQLARHTDVSRIGLVEKHSSLAAVNSHARSNSQTLHCGDIETNYTVEKAKKVKAAADKLARYAQVQPDRDRILFRCSKMVLGVGPEEVALLRQRFETFRELYPHMRLLEKEEIAQIEPNVALVGGKPRPEEIVALGSVDQYSAVDFKALTESFIRNGSSAEGKITEVHLDTKVLSITQDSDGFRVQTSKGEIRAKIVVVSAGAHSLYLAQRMGYGLEYSTLPVAGSFYYTPKVLNGKVYTVQDDRLPFAAIHGDPDVIKEGVTRWGPTALVLPKLERYIGGTVGEFFKTFHMGVATVLLRMLKHPTIRAYLIRNILFEVPGIRRRLFLKEARKIVPSLKLEDLAFAEGVGGIRPQVVDRAKKVMLLGEAKINPGTGILFNMTPSPGATSCLDNAEKDAELVLGFLGRETAS